MVTALTKHILEEGGKNLITFTHLEHDIADTLSRYADAPSSSKYKKIALKAFHGFQT